jgi:hypothetical protein
MVGDCPGSVAVTVEQALIASDKLAISTSTFVDWLDIAVLKGCSRLTQEFRVDSGD